MLFCVIQHTLGSTSCICIANQNKLDGKLNRLFKNTLYFRPSCESSCWADNLSVQVTSNASNTICQICVCCLQKEKTNIAILHQQNSRKSFSVLGYCNRTQKMEIPAPPVQCSHSDANIHLRTTTTIIYVHFHPVDLWVMRLLISSCELI